MDLNVIWIIKLIVGRSNWLIFQFLYLYPLENLYLYAWRTCLLKEPISSLCLLTNLDYYSSSISRLDWGWGEMGHICEILNTKDYIFLSMTPYQTCTYFLDFNQNFIAQVAMVVHSVPPTRGFRIYLQPLMGEIYATSISIFVGISTHSGYQIINIHTLYFTH